jgi:hypothetical protein
MVATHRRCKARASSGFLLSLATTPRARRGAVPSAARWSTEPWGMLCRLLDDLGGLEEHVLAIVRPGTQAV